MRTLLIYTLAAVLLACFAPLWASAAPAGRIEVNFLYLEPGESTDPTYHTAMWIEDAKGKMVQTLFVSNELSTTYYETGKACPDWVKQSGWAKAPRSLINAVTGPTPNVSEGMMSFDLGKLGIEPGKYKFRFEVNIDDTIFCFKAISKSAIPSRNLRWRRYTCHRNRTSERTSPRM
jgi:hypothetical protein